MIKYLFLFLLIHFSYGLNETELRMDLFRDYNTNNRPVKNISDNVILEYGLEISNLVYFDQKSENIEITMKNILSWKDEYLQWNLTKKTPKYIIVPNNLVWIPDLELYNSAKKPKIYDKNPIVKIYNTGRIEYIRHLSYSFACKLDLINFPFDKQTCNMLFGSWKYSKEILDLMPFKEGLFKNFSVSSKFSHNEWNIDKISLEHKDYKYNCCPGKLWPNSKYSITLKRNFNKYNILIIMSIFISFSALCISLLKVDNYYRTYILVFIPLTLIWLQLHTSSLIPIIEHATKLENIIMCCFYTTIISAFESGILYCISTNYYFKLLKYFKLAKYNKIKCGFHYKNYKIFINKHDVLIYKNLDYKKFYKLIKKIDNYFKIIITIVFIISIIILLIY